MLDSTRTKATRRVNIIEGQFRGLKKAIEADAYCMDILTQSLAIQKSLASLNKLIVENHISTHIQEMLASGDDKLKDKALAELSQLYELHNIRGK